MESQFVDILILPYDNGYYVCVGCDFVETNWTQLMKLVLLVKKFPETLDIINELTKNNPNEIHQKNSHKSTALMIACINCETYSSIECVRLLINYDANVNDKDICAQTILMLISIYVNRCSSIDRVCLLLDCGANVNDKDDSGQTSLTMVAKCADRDSSVECAQLLIDHCADINDKDDFGCTSLMYVCEYYGSESNIECVSLFLNHGANINDKNNCGSTSLTFAPKCVLCVGSMKCVKLLIDSGANANDKDEQGFNSLMHLFNDNTKITECDINTFMILIHKSKLTICGKNKYRLTAYDYYTKNNHCILSEDQLDYLRGIKSLSMTKSARH